ncbi:MAG: helix-turn-helix transcriptional regulator [Oscillospiraceae bacterium]|nr:helix-turn-helix transcriptional regulator [Oscillospiraceae bacterium]
MRIPKNEFIVSLADTSDNVVTDRLCMEGFACHQFLLVDKPGFTISQEVCETEFAAGDIIYAAAEKRFGIRCDGDMRIRYIAFTGKRLRPLLHYCGFGAFRVISLPEKNDAHALFNEIFRLHNSGNDVEISAALYSLLSHLGAVRIEADNYIYEKQGLTIKPIIDYMQRNYRKDDISLSHVLSYIGISRDEADILFLNIFSVNMADFYKRLRMENAKHLLFFYHQYGTRYVAKNMGYESAEQFYADFYNVFKMSPDEFTALYHKKHM